MKRMILVAMFVAACGGPEPTSDAPSRIAFRSTIDADHWIDVDVTRDDLGVTGTLCFREAAKTADKPHLVVSTCSDLKPR